MNIKILLVLINSILFQNAAGHAGEKYTRSETVIEGGQIEFPVVKVPGGSAKVIAVIKQVKQQGWPIEAAIGDEMPILQIGSGAKTQEVSFNLFVKSGDSTSLDSIWIRELVSTSAPNIEPSKVFNPIVNEWKLAGKRRLRVEMSPTALKGYSLVRLGNGSYGSHQMALCFGQPPHQGDVVEVSLFKVVLGTEEQGTSTKTHVIVSLAICGTKVLKGKSNRDNTLFKSAEALSVRFLPESEMVEAAK